ncbi:protein of unknown function (plasmid) [Azospirillum lipoferum 4B]|uniref:Uncharacterized protein n=1 Tax=Azospirillum lipoferum (strain 4B) TaxID=862719 RepID=G7ZIM8_AZOL4|nr:protein of unknown function [Azospirillum lipoferum 4B]
MSSSQKPSCGHRGGQNQGGTQPVPPVASFRQLIANEGIKIVKVADTMSCQLELDLVHIHAGNYDRRVRLGALEELSRRDDGNAVNLTTLIGIDHSLDTHLRPTPDGPNHQMSSLSGAEYEQRNGRRQMSHII